MELVLVAEAPRSLGAPSRSRAHDELPVVTCVAGVGRADGCKALCVARAAFDWGDVHSTRHLPPIATPVATPVAAAIPTTVSTVITTIITTAFTAFTASAIAFAIAASTIAVTCFAAAVTTSTATFLAAAFLASVERRCDLGR